ncbi:MAG: PEP-CTERM sorting domain-containing protein [Phycisphaerae bacterium]|nr:PEP-CTERM sorting domain-containing protein [Phycisphaerae bacterium]
MRTFVYGLVVGALAGTSVAQVNFTGVYAQDFNGLAQSGSTVLTGRGPHSLLGVLGSTGVEGWEGANPSGTSGNTEVRAHNGGLAGSSGRGVVFFGTDGSSDRALGALPTSNQVSSFGVLLTNNSTDTFTGVDISYFGEQWRAGGADIPNLLSFFYGFGPSIDAATTAFTALDFAAPNLSGGELAIDGNAAGNRQFISATIADLAWAPGTTLALRWNIADLPGQDNGLGIDDFRIVGIPGPGSLALLGLGMIGCGRRRR